MLFILSGIPRHHPRYYVAGAFYGRGWECYILLPASRGIHRYWSITSFEQPPTKCVNSGQLEHLLRGLTGHNRGSAMPPASFGVLDSSASSSGARPTASTRLSHVLEGIPAGARVSRSHSLAATLGTGNPVWSHRPANPPLSMGTPPAAVAGTGCWFLGSASVPCPGVDAL